MSHGDESARRIPGWCALCRSRCGCISVVEGDRLTAVEPDPSHPTGQALCAKGRAAPELVHHPERLLYPMVRTNPKGADDPGWRRVSWDEALDRVAAEMRRLAAESGPESVVFAVTTPSGTGISDAGPWIDRLMNAFGSPSNCYGTEICNWHKDHATAYTFGAGVGTPDLDHTGCILLWGHNPGSTWLAQGSRVAKARARGTALVVVDPRRAGPAAKADVWLAPRPGTDAAVALGLIRLTLEHGWQDDDFVHDWTNAPALVCDDTGRLLAGRDLAAPVASERPVAFDTASGALAGLDPGPTPGRRWQLTGAVEVETVRGPVRCRPVLERLREAVAPWTPAQVQAVTGVEPAALTEAARLLATARPVSYYAWSGVAQHTNATQIDRAITVLYALTGSLGRRGGNVHFNAVPTTDMRGRELLPESQRARTLGLAERPLGPPRDGWVTAEDLYRAVLERDPYPVRGLVAFGADVLVGRAGAPRGARALAALDFYVHLDLFENPAARHADVLLPVSSPWEREALRVGFEIDQAANARVQLRPAAVPARGESRSDVEIAFDLACRLGLGNQFFQGDVDAGMQALLGPSGLTVGQLRARPEGLALNLPPPWDAHVTRGGFPTPSGRVELWSDVFAAHGQPPLPVHVEPPVGPVSRPDLAARFPLVLTSVKSHLYCHGQHRNLPSLRRRAPDPPLEIHPRTAQARGIADGDWVRVETPSGTLRARARLRDTLAPGVVAAQHGWWQACTALDAPAYPVHGDGTANVNAVIDAAFTDPVSGATPNRSYLCEVRREA
ncbi:MAG: molybdopterin-dependent oxidoreductase [Ectothiorhodospiraceae bacterium]|nr:molybdopterin-dependent oxidoreductase [Ectothiorhodospiraceae bacterium]